MPPWRCSALYQRKNDRQNVFGLALIPEPSGKRGMVLQGFELSLGKRVVIRHLRPAQRAGHAEVSEKLSGALVSSLEPPRSECRVRRRGWTPCFRQLCWINRPARAEFSRSATIQPTT